MKKKEEKKRNEYSRLGKEMDKGTKCNMSNDRIADKKEKKTK